MTTRLSIRLRAEAYLECGISIGGAIDGVAGGTASAVDDEDAAAVSGCRKFRR